MLSGLGSATNAVFLANASAGGNTGADCADAKAYTYFNSAGNWSGSPSGILIGPDTTVHLCGTIGSATVGSSVTLMTAQGSGTSGHPIIIKWESAATLQAPDFGGGGAALVLDNQSFITLDGGGTGNAGAGTFVQNGIIQATLSGTTGGSCIGGACTTDNGGTGISATNTANITINNLLIRNIYLRTSTSDYNSGTGKPDWAAFFGIHASPSSNLTINNNYITETGQNLAPNGNNIIISNNYLDQSNHEVDMGAGTTSWSGLYIFGNHFSSMNHWDSSDPSLPYHHDGIHIQPGGPGFYSNVFIYNNTFDGDVGSVSVTGWIYAEQTCCTGGTIWVFNNTATATPGRSAPAIFGIYGASTENIANNTIFQSFYTGGGISLDAGLNSSVTINLHQNNIMWGQSFDAKIQTGTIVNGTGALNFNTYVDGSANGNVDNFTYPGNDTQSLTTWKTTALPGATTHDANSQLIAPASINLNTDGSLQAGSPAIAAGTNLFSLCNGQANPGLGALCNDKNGNARPTSGPWDAGAFNSGTTFTLTVTVVGSGTVTSSPAGISCPGTCSATFASATVVTSTASASGGNTFTGWSGIGGCTGTSTCVLTLSSNQAATATFTPIAVPPGFSPQTVISQLSNRTGVAQ